jgi:hypothetical protein
MALHWHFDEDEHPRVRDDERVYELTTDMHYKLTPMAETLVLLTMPCGMQKVTADNAHEFYARLKILERLDGPFFRNADGPTNLEAAHVHAMIGLRVNVPQETRTTWRKRILDSNMNALSLEFKRAKKELDKQRAEEIAGLLGLA